MKKKAVYELCLDLEYKKYAKESIVNPNGIIKRGKNLLTKKKFNNLSPLLSYSIKNIVETK